MSAGYQPADVERRWPEPDKHVDTGRSPFERDRARVLHSAALRRLAAKTQVVGVGVDDFPRTRLTHSLECAQIGRELAHALGADPDVVDAGCLAHDLGHPPYGHNGEAALDAAASSCGGFEGNAQSFRVLTRLEAKLVGPAGESRGLNLTRATLDAATKYPWPRRADTAKFGVYADDADAFTWMRAGAPDGGRCIEAQMMDWADDIAYSVHDFEDGVHTGHVKLEALESSDERAALCALALELDPDVSDLEPILDELVALEWWPRQFDGAPAAVAALKLMTSELIGRFCGAAIEATRAASGDQSLCRYNADLAIPSRARAECVLLKAIATRYVMTRDAALSRQEREREIIAELLAAVADRAPDSLDPVFRPSWHAATDDPTRLRIAVDQVASLTDTSAAAWHARYCRS